MKLINQKGNYTIDDIHNYITTIIKMNLYFKGYDFNKNPKILTRYGVKRVNSKFYEKIKITGDQNPKFLTKEEFRAGKQGYIM
jgi:hypothetical protein